MKNYFSKKMFYFSFIVVLLTASGFILTSSSSGTSPKGFMINKLLNAPIEKSFAFLSSDSDEAMMKLESAGINFDGATSIKDLASKNKTSPFRIVDIISK